MYELNKKKQDPRHGTKPFSISDSRFDNRVAITANRWLYRRGWQDKNKTPQSFQKQLFPID